MSTLKMDRVWSDGCFDAVHYGHANQLRQAKQFGGKLIVGVHNDEEILLHKGPPLFPQEERYRMVKSIKWVDEVVDDAPYVTTVSTLDRYNCRVAIHGDDITTSVDGKDTYDEVKKAGRFVECKRTEGISTTNVLGRVLLLARIHFSQERDIILARDKAILMSMDEAASLPSTGVSRIISPHPTIENFVNGKSPKPRDRIVYVCGAFDLFHVGHLSFLEEARKLGDYLIVGVLDDKTVNGYKGLAFPIQNLVERVLTVMAYKPVDHVIMAAPYDITENLLDAFNISVVVQGSIPREEEDNGNDRFSAAKRRGIYRQIDSGSQITTDTVLERIILEAEKYQKKYQKKSSEEAKSS